MLLFLDDALLLWQDGSDLAVVVFQVTYCCCSLNGPDLDVVVFWIA
jgi:hypothetical protein